MTHSECVKRHGLINRRSETYTFSPPTPCSFSSHISRSASLFCLVPLFLHPHSRSCWTDSVWLGVWWQLCFLPPALILDKGHKVPEAKLTPRAWVWNSTSVCAIPGHAVRYYSESLLTALMPILIIIHIRYYIKAWVKSWGLFPVWKCGIVQCIH